MSLAGIVGLTLGGVDIQRPDLDVFLALDEGLDELPSMRGGSDLIPFRHGRLPTERFADTRRLTLNGWITGKSSASMRPQFRAYVDSVKAVLDMKDSIILAATIEDGSIRWANVRVDNIVAGQTIASGARLVSVELEALDPFWYSASGSWTLDSGYFLDAGQYLDSGSEVVITGSANRTIDTFGTADIERVRVRFVGPSAGSVGLETVETSPVGFTIARTLAAGETLEVDSYARTALLGGVSFRDVMTLAAGNRHGEYIRLTPGTVTLRAIGGAAQTRVQFTPTWL